MLLIPFIVLLIADIIQPKSKILSVVTGILFTFVFAFEYVKGDLQQYENFYNTESLSLFLRHYEPFFALPLTLFKISGLPFGAFRLFFTLVYVFMNWKFIKEATDYKALALILIFVYPSMHFISVMRSGMATGVVLLSIWILVRGGMHAKRNYIIGIVCATLCHYSSIFFLLFLLVDINKEIDYRKFLGLLFISIVATFILNFTDLPMKLLSSLTSREKTLAWITNGTRINLTGTLVIFGLLGISAYLSWEARYLCHTNGAPLLLTRKQINLSSYSYNISLILLLCLPIFVYTGTSQRLIYMMAAINICSWLNAAKVLRETPGNQRVLPIFSVMVVIFIFVWRIAIDLPYIKDGAIPFAELVSTKFVF